MKRQRCIATRLSPGGGSHGAVVADLLQVVGQAVVDRTTEAVWSTITDELGKLLDCGSADNSFPNVCGLMAHARLQDLISSPNVLLQAIEADLMKILMDKIKANADLKAALEGTGAILNIALAEAAPTWKHNGPQALATELLRKLRLALLKQTSTVTCADITTDPPEPAQVIWMVEECLVQAGDDSEFSEVLQKCDTSSLSKTCATGDEQIRDRLFSYLVNALTAKKPLVIARYVVMYVLDSVKLQLASHHHGPSDPIYRAADDFEATLIGIFDLDWVRVTTAAAALLNDLASLDRNLPRSEERFFQIVAAVGQYAATYGADADPKAALEARKQVLDAFIKSQTSRANRRGVAVFSLGGSFGLGGAYRRSFDGATSGAVAPVLLPIGVAVQTYRDCTRCNQVGLHLQLSALDLGQYVSFEGGEAKVGAPNLGNVVAPSVTVGVWFWKPEVPFFIAAHAGLAPFVREDGEPVWFAGGMIGAYVPFFDFN